MVSLSALSRETPAVASFDAQALSLSNLRVSRVFFLALAWTTLFVATHGLLTGWTEFNILLSVPLSLAANASLGLLLVLTLWTRHPRFWFACTSLLFTLPLIQVGYYVSSHDFLDLGMMSILFDEPRFMVQTFLSELSGLTILFSVFACILAVTLNAALFWREISIVRGESAPTLRSPFSLLSKWWLLLPCAALALGQAHWAWENDHGKLFSRPFYPFFLLFFLSIAVFMFRESACRRVKLLLLTPVAFFVATTILFNVRLGEKAKTLSFDLRFSQAALGAYFSMKPPSNLEHSKEAASRFASVPQIAMPFNILVILYDGSRLDHFGSVNYVRKTDDALTDLYKKSFVFHYPISIANYTDAGVPALLSGIGADKPAHLIKDNLVLWDYFAKSADTFFMSSQDTTWAELNRFYQSPGQKFLWSAALQPEAPANHDKIDDSISAEKLLSHLHSLSKPFVGVWQLNSTHYPYFVPHEGPFSPCSLDRTKGPQQIINCYDNGIAYQTHVVAEVLKHINLTNTVVIITSDHGEAFNEHGIYFHTTDLHQEVVKVPFMVYIPEQIQKRIPQEKLTNLRDQTHHILSNADLVPTLLDLTKMVTGASLTPAGVPFSGKSLFEKQNNRVVFSSGCFPEYRCHYRDVMFADNDYYLIMRAGETPENWKLYRTWNDLSQSKPLSVATTLHQEERFQQFINRLPSAHPTGNMVRQMLKMTKNVN